MAIRGTEYAMGPMSIMDCSMAIPFFCNPKISVTLQSRFEH